MTSESVWCSRPLWLGIAATMLYLGPYCIILSILMDWIKELPETYIVNTAAGSAASLVDFFGTPLILWLSEPSRLGRRSAYLILCLCACSTLGAAWLSGGGVLGAYINLSIKVVFSLVGGGNPQGANYGILCAFFADSAPSHMHVAGFSILLGSQFFCMGVFPISAIALKPVLGEQGLVLFAFCFSLIQIPFVLLCFPPKTPTQQVALAGSPPLTDPIAEPAAPADSVVSEGARKDICKALGWIFRERLAATVVWLSISFVGAADSSNIMLFLEKGLGFTTSQVNMVVGSIGLFGVVVSLGLIPWMSKFVSKGFLVCVSTVSTVFHCLTYGFLTNVMEITALGFFGAATFAAIPPLLGYMNKDNNSGVSHGVLLGAFCGLKNLAVILGPPVLAGCLQAEQDGHAICYFIPLQNWAGSGFAVCSILMVPALIASMFLLVEGREEKNPALIKAGSV